MENAQPVDAISINLNWCTVAPMIMAALENGTDEGRRIAREELLKMAKAADASVALVAAIQAATDNDQGVPV